MSTENRISKALAALLPGGTLGASILLALSAPTLTEARSVHGADAPAPAGNQRRLGREGSVAHSSASASMISAPVP